LGGKTASFFRNNVIYREAYAVLAGTAQPITARYPSHVTQTSQSQHSPNPALLATKHRQKYTRNNSQRGGLNLEKVEKKVHIY